MKRRRSSIKSADAGKSGFSAFSSAARPAVSSVVSHASSSTWGSYPPRAGANPPGRPTPLLARDPESHGADRPAAANSPAGPSFSTTQKRSFRSTRFSISSNTCSSLAATSDGLAELRSSNAAGGAASAAAFASPPAIPLKSLPSPRSRSGRRSGRGARGQRRSVRNAYAAVRDLRAQQLRLRRAVDADDAAARPHREAE
jgi:hypothetical protein